MGFETAVRIPQALPLTPTSDSSSLSPIARENSTRNMFSLMEPLEKSLFSKVVLRWAKTTRDACLNAMIRAWTSWSRHVIFKRIIEARESHLREELIAEAIIRIKPPQERTSEDIQHLVAWARKTKALKDITRAKLELLFSQVGHRDLSHGEPLFFQGERPDAYWVVLSGTLRLFISSKNEEQAILKVYKHIPCESLIASKELLEGRLGKHIADLTQGTGLGELSLLGLGSVFRACAAVSASTRVSLLHIPIPLYNQVLRKDHMRALDMKARVDFLHSINAFTHWKREDASRIAYVLKEVEYPPKAKVYEAADKVRDLILLRDGRVRVVHRTKGVMLASLGPRELVGVEALLERLSDRLGLSRTLPPQGNLRRKGGGGGGGAGGGGGGLGAKTPPVQDPTASTGGVGTAPSVSGTARYHVVAETTVQAYALSLDDVLKFCTGGHGLRTKSILENTMALRRNSRKEHFGRMRRLQKVLRFQEASQQHSHLPETFRSYADAVLGQASSDMDDASLVSVASKASTASWSSRTSGRSPGPNIGSPARRHVPALPPLEAVGEEANSSVRISAGRGSAGVWSGKGCTGGSKINITSSNRNSGLKSKFDHETPGFGSAHVVDIASPLQPQSDKDVSCSRSLPRLPPWEHVQSSQRIPTFAAAGSRILGRALSPEPCQAPQGFSMPRFQRCDKDRVFREQARILRNQLLESERRLHGANRLTERAKAESMKQAQKRIGVL